MRGRGSTVAKRTITQRSFVLGEVRNEFLEAKDLEVRGASLRGGLNARIKATRTLAGRPGTFYVREDAGAYDIVELRPLNDLVFGLLVSNTRIDVITDTGATVYSNASVPWSDASTVWVETFREITVIGCPAGIFTLTYDNGLWSWATFAFDVGPGGNLSQPYWVFKKGVVITPSGTTGGIAITASEPIWTPAYVGLRIRYNRREILITGYVSPTVVYGNVISILPNSYRVTVADGSTFRVGDAVVSQDTDYQGVVAGVSGNDIDLITLEVLDGPDIGEGLSNPRASSDVTAKVTLPPLPSGIWDEPLISSVRGYPRAAAAGAGRLVFVDFPLVPDLIVASSARTITDFLVGVNDDDAIARQCGDNSPRFLHVLNAGDLLLFSDRGLYYVSLRDNGILTPSTFNAVLFDKRASNAVRPVAVDDGVLFVEASGESIAACLLDGNIYLKWSVRTISIYHDHLIKTPVKLCGPSIYSELPEKYLFVINSDGTSAVMSWSQDFEPETVGFLPWETQGDFVSISKVFGGYWAIVDRQIGATQKRMIERFSEDAKMDCTCLTAASERFVVNGSVLQVNGSDLVILSNRALPLAGATVGVYGQGWFGGTRLVGVDGTVPDLVDMPAGTTCGLIFQTRILVWPVEHVESPYTGIRKARLVSGSVSILSSGPFAIRANSSTRRLGDYAAFDSFNAAPPLQTRVHRFVVWGNRDHPELEIIHDEPGEFQILAITQEVTY